MYTCITLNAMRAVAYLPHAHDKINTLRYYSMAVIAAIYTRIDYVNLYFRCFPHHQPAHSSSSFNTHSPFKQPHCSAACLPLITCDVIGPIATGLDRTNTAVRPVSLVTKTDDGAGASSGRKSIRAQMTSSLVNQCGGFLQAALFFNYSAF